MRAIHWGTAAVPECRGPGCRRARRRPRPASTASSRSHNYSNTGRRPRLCRPPKAAGQARRHGGWWRAGLHDRSMVTQGHDDGRAGKEAIHDHDDEDMNRPRP